MSKQRVLFVLFAPIVYLMFVVVGFSFALMAALASMRDLWRSI